MGRKRSSTTKRRAGEDSNPLRETLDEWSRFLYDYSLATFAIGLMGPPGRATQYALEGAAAALALGFTGESIWRLTDDSRNNAAEINDVTNNQYKNANQEVLKGLACDPFGPERSQLPTRLNPPVPNQQPDPLEPPPSPYPPAKPLGESGSPAPGLAAPGPLPVPSQPAPVPAPAPRFAPPVAPAASAPPATAVPAPRVSAAPPPASPAVGARPGRSGERAPVTSPRSTATVDEPTPVPAR